METALFECSQRSSMFTSLTLIGGGGLGLEVSCSCAPPMGEVPGGVGALTEHSTHTIRNQRESPVSPSGQPCRGSWQEGSNPNYRPPRKRIKTIRIQRTLSSRAPSALGSRFL